MVSFELETVGGVVLVDGTEADLELKPKRVSPRSVERERAFIVGHGRAAEVTPVATFREIALTPGMRVAVHGMAMIEATTGQGAERGYRDSGPTRARLTPVPLAIGAPRRWRSTARASPCWTIYLGVAGAIYHARMPAAPDGSPAFERRKS
jgi:hypothetical protein